MVDGHAGSYIVEDVGPEGRSVFRLFHNLLAEHLRGAPTQGGAAHTESTIVEALIATLSPDLSSRWTTAHPYVRTFLAQHAAGGGRRLCVLSAEISASLRAQTQQHSHLC